MTNGIVEQISVGLPQTYGQENAADPMDQVWTSAFYKYEVKGPVTATQTLIEGDGQFNLKNHGGIDKAILVYAASHYDYWRTSLKEQLNGQDFQYGAFGENLTVSHFDEENVCLGDEYQIGEVVIQVSQPRHPCWKLARRWRIPNLEKTALEQRKLGWYARVLKTGVMEAGQAIELINRPLPEWTIQKLNHMLYTEIDNLAANQFIAECPVLAESWKKPFLERIK